MTDDLRTELDAQTANARKAYLAFMTSGKILRRPSLSPSDAAKAQAIHGEALGTLTASLTRMREIGEELHPVADSAPERGRAPRYSTDARRGTL